MWAHKSGRSNGAQRFLSTRVRAQAVGATPSVASAPRTRRRSKQAGFLIGFSRLQRREALASTTTGRVGAHLRQCTVAHKGRRFWCSPHNDFGMNIPHVLIQGDAAKAPLETSAEVSALWRRCMPRSGCWDILIQCRAVCFDVGTGEVAGAVYFDTRNKYIPCVGVDAKFRRRGLGEKPGGWPTRARSGAC